MNLLKEQIRLETQYSKDNARRVVMMELEKAGFEVNYKLHQWIEDVTNWFNTDAPYRTMNEEKQRVLQSTSVEDLTVFFSEVMALTLISPSPLNIQAVLGQCIAFAKFGDQATFKYQMKIASELVIMMAQLDVLEIYIGEALTEDEDGNEIVEDAIWVSNAYSVSDDVLTYISQLQYLPPLIVKPRKPVNNRDSGGYYTVVKPMVLNHSRNTHDYPMDASAISILQDIAFSFDEHVLAVREEPNKPLDTLQKKKQFNLLREGSAQVYLQLQSLTDKFRFHWREDKRGRLYSQG